jgi:hypothetical protein
MTELEEEVEEKIDELVDDNDIEDKLLEILKGYEYSNSTWGHEDGSKVYDILGEYELWYNSAHPLVQEYLPDRIEEFEDANKKIRKCLEIDLKYLDNHDITGIGALKSKIASGTKLQISLVKSIPDRVETEQLKARRSVSSNIVTNEVEKAKELFDDGNIRASGVIAGVALERHLLTLCESSEKELDFGYMDGITSLAQELSNANEISDDEQRNLEYLAGIRNNCSHATDEEPERREVERLLNQSDEFIRS